ncbi:uncharacterized protein TNCT_151291, partial [Trichonephila clavata]
DQALQIAQNVGSAFSELSLQELNQTDYFDVDTSRAEIEDKQAEALINDCFLSENAFNARNYQQQNLRISTEDQEYLDDLTPPLQSSNMRGPTTETSEQNPYRNSSIPPAEDKFPSSAHHQIQLLRYQLDQQSQQTQLALHQVQLLTDQVEAESGARRKAQEQNNNLMIQNQELLNHIERLFQQIEDFEKQIQLLEMGKRSKNPHPLEPQVTQIRTPLSYSTNRRLSSDSTPSRTAPSIGRVTQPNTRRSSLTTTKPSISQTKPTMTTNQTQQNPSILNRRSPLVAPKPFTGSQNKMGDNTPKKKETLHIGDTSPPVQSGTQGPFGSAWKLKSSEQNQMDVDPSTSGVGRTRTASFSSISKIKPPENVALKSTAFNNTSGLSGVASITNKRFSSSTSDLYNTSTYQVSKPLLIEDSSTDSKGPISNVSVNTTSKLPRFQPYIGRRSSLTKEYDQFSAITKDKFKSNTQSSLFNR